jgi:hypothetical protein
MGRGMRGCGKEARRSGGGAIGTAGVLRVRWGIGRAWGPPVRARVRGSSSRTTRGQNHGAALPFWAF